eukprot:scaffold19235_cov126-Isochrysis_galbana.AAC.16
MHLYPHIASASWAGAVPLAPEQTRIAPAANRGNETLLAATSPLPRVRRAGPSFSCAWRRGIDRGPQYQYHWRSRSR